jgi:hypothetical protein
MVGHRSDGTYSLIADLPLEIEAYGLHPMVRDTSSHFTKVSTVVRLWGLGEEGLGEDVTWDQIDHIEQFRLGSPLPLSGKYTLQEFCDYLSELELFPTSPCHDVSYKHRRWGYESAALDLALRQNDLSLAQALNRKPQPMEFVVSITLGDSPSIAPLRHLLRITPNLAFKLDPTPNWTKEFIDELVTFIDVRTIDLKGRYRNVWVAQPADLSLYQSVIENFPNAWLEDPELTDATAELLYQNQDRVTWDEPIHAISDIEALPWQPQMLNIKPARIGRLQEVFAVYDYCEQNGIQVYGGGMFELGPGRGQLEYLASLFCPAAPNDLAPPDYNMLYPKSSLPASPLSPQLHQRGFRWDELSLRRSIRAPQLPSDALGMPPLQRYT